MLSEILKKNLSFPVVNYLVCYKKDFIPLMKRG